VPKLVEYGMGMGLLQSVFVGWALVPASHDHFNHWLKIGQENQISQNESGLVFLLFTWYTVMLKANFEKYFWQRSTFLQSKQKSNRRKRTASKCNSAK